jgi:hypothetical protein
MASIMHDQLSQSPSTSRPPVAYLAAMADVEARAARGELTLAQAKGEIFALRERFCAGPAVVMQWAVQPH